jgi:hypothetical protein
MWAPNFEVQKGRESLAQEKGREGGGRVLVWVKGERLVWVRAERKGGRKGGGFVSSSLPLFVSSALLSPSFCLVRSPLH